MILTRLLARLLTCPSRRYGSRISSPTPTADAVIVRISEGQVPAELQRFMPLEHLHTLNE